MENEQQQPETQLVRKPEQGKAGYALAWLLGVPIPILLVVYLVSKCV